MKKSIHIGIGGSATTAKGFIDAWKRAERGEKAEAEHRLNFESLESLLKILTPGRWALLKKLRESGPMSIRALASELKRDYKNVHRDVKKWSLLGSSAGPKMRKYKSPGILLKRGFGWRLEFLSAGKEHPG